MTPEFWQQRWQRGEIGWHAGDFNRHLTDHWETLGVDPSSRVFVPLCGKSLDLLWLAGRGHRVLGVELSELAARAFCDENGLTPTIIEEPPFRRWRMDEIELLVGDFFDLGPSHLAGAGACYDRASLIALPPPQRPRYAEHLARLLPAGARSLLITLDYDSACMSGPPFAVAEPEVRQLFGKSFEIAQLAEHDALAENPKFRQRGLDRLVEHVYLLMRGA